jgi:Domain of unknown function (DUF1877)
VACRGVLLALDVGDAQALEQARSDTEVLEALWSIQDRLDPDFWCPTEKTWDAIHRCLTDGRLSADNGTFPLNRRILGGKQLHHGDGWIIALTPTAEVPAVAAALHQVSEAFLRERFAALDPADYELGLSPEDFTATWALFGWVKELWSVAAAAGRAVVFMVDQ